MRHALIGFTAGVVMFGSAAALAWDLDRYWENAAHGPEAAAGGLYGTGSARDEGQLCLDCHPKTGGTAPTIDLTFTFTPALQGTKYVAGTAYQVTARLTGEHVFGTSPNGQINFNGFAARFENTAGQHAGTLRSDTTPASCPQTLPGNITMLAGTSWTQGTCEFIHHRAKPNTMALTAWTFGWTAPAAGAGTVTVRWGVVDGDGKENSRDDEAKNGTLVIGEM